MITILIAGNDKFKNLCSLIEAEADFQFIGQAATGTKALEMATELNPDILLLDLVMLDSNGLEILNQLRSKNLPTQGIVLSKETNGKHVLVIQPHESVTYIIRSYSIIELSAVLREILNNRYNSN